MNWSQFKDPVSYMYLAGTVVVSWCITQEVADSSPFNDKYFATEFSSVKTFRENSNKATPKRPHCTTASNCQAVF